MRIMIVSDPIWSESGYGRVGRALAHRLRDDGHEVAVFGPAGFSGGKIFYDGITCLSGGFGDDRGGNHTYYYHLRDEDPDLVITLLDAPALHSYGAQNSPWWGWFPIDSAPICRTEMGVIGRADRVLCPSKWGVKQLLDQGIDALYLPYGVEGKDFYFDPEGRARVRKEFGIRDNEFLVGAVGLNYPAPDRKGWGFAMTAMKLLHDKYPEMVGYIHTDVTPSQNLNDVLGIRRILGLDTVLRFPPVGGSTFLSEDDMRALYSAFDVYLCSSLTEGFCVPLVESQMCGTPVVINMTTSQQDLLGPGGVGAPPICDWFINDASMVGIPHAGALAEALEVKLLEWKNTDQAIIMEDRRKISAWAHNNYDWDTLYETRWRPLLTEVPERVEMRGTDGERLILGCGTRPTIGAVNHDKTLHHDYVDVAHDLNEFPWPWEDESFDVIEMSDVIEHLTAGVPEIMDEAWRILRPGGAFRIATCRAGEWQHVTDPTHTRGFMLNSFDYWDPETPYGKTYGVAYTDKAWKMIRRFEHDGGIMVILTPRKGNMYPVAEEKPEIEMVAI